MTPKDILVLGAGIVGVSTALALQARGHHVTLLDRQAPGREASYGNAGLIQREAVEPYAFPRDRPTLLGAALGRLNAIHYHAAALPELLGPLYRYWRNSAPKTHQRIAQDYSTLIAHSTAEHAPLIAASGAEHLVRRQGWHQAYRTPAAFEAAARDAQRVRSQYGVSGRPVDSLELAAIEPALIQPMAGSILWEDAWSITDTGGLVQLYAQHFVQLGGVFQTGQNIELRQTPTGWSAQGAAGASAAVSAQEAVIALGAGSFEAVHRLGYTLPLFIKRGYHRHFKNPFKFSISMLDAENGIMLAPMGRGLRLATGAEFARLNAPPTPVQIKRSEILAREIVDLGDPVESQPWLGARPCSADMKPLVGPAWRHRGLWFNFGHGHQGLTLGPATARLLAEQVDGAPTFVDPAPFLPERFKS